MQNQRPSNVYIMMRLRKWLAPPFRIWRSNWNDSIALQLGAIRLYLLSIVLASLTRYSEGLEDASCLLQQLVSNWLESIASVLRNYTATNFTSARPHLEIRMCSFLNSAPFQNRGWKCSQSLPGKPDRSIITIFLTQIDRSSTIIHDLHRPKFRR